MTTYVKNKLSDSTNGRGIKITQTGTPGDDLHTAVTGTTDFDEIYIYAVNSDSADKKLTIEFGGVSTPDDLIEITVKGESGLVLIIPGFLLNNALDVAAFCETANVVMIHGYIHEIRA